jgi:hypothetical protein
MQPSITTLSEPNAVSQVILVGTFIGSEPVMQSLSECLSVSIASSGENQGLRTPELRRTSIQSLSDIDRLEELATVSPDACFFIFYRGSATDLSAALTQAADLEQSVEHWMLLHRRLMSFLRRYRPRAVLFNVDVALADIEGTAASCLRLGIELSSAKIDLPPSPSGALEHWLVQQWLAERPETQVFESALEAFAQPLGDKDRDIEKRSLDEVLGAYLALIGQRNALGQAAEGARKEAAELKASEAKVSTAKKELAEENELLLLQLHQVQEELESMFLARQQSERAAETANNEITKLKAAEAKALAEKQALAAENKRLAERLDQAQKELETAISAKQLSEQAAETVRGEIANQKASEAKALAEKKELVEENELLLLQLHQVQEELEAYFLENLRLQKMQPDDSAQQPSDSEDIAAVSAEHEDDSNSSAEPPKKSLLEAYRYKRKLKEYQRLVAASELFDAEWYLSVNDDVAKAGMDPAEHYVRYGSDEGRDPSPHFSTTSYLAINDDVAEAGMNPLVHYLLYGKDEGRILSRPRSAW